MFGLIPLFFIGRSFYQLAHEHNRQKWPFALMGVGIALACQFIIGFIFGIILVLTGNEQLLDHGMVLSVVAFLVSIGVIYLIYRYLDKKWKKNPVDYLKDDGELLDR